MTKVYQIFPVSNGFIVQVPFDDVNPFEGLKEFMTKNEIDLLLKMSDKEIEKVDKNTFIFQELNQALAFLQKRLA